MTAAFTGRSGCRAARRPWFTRLLGTKPSRACQNRRLAGEVKLLQVQDRTAWRNPLCSSRSAQVNSDLVLERCSCFVGTHRPARPSSLQQRFGTRTRFSLNRSPLGQNDFAGQSPPLGSRSPRSLAMVDDTVQRNEVRTHRFHFGLRQDGVDRAWDAPKSLEKMHGIRELAVHVERPHPLPSRCRGAYPRRPMWCRDRRNPGSRQFHGGGVAAESHHLQLVRVQAPRPRSIWSVSSAGVCVIGLSFKQLDTPSARFPRKRKFRL